MEQQAIDRSKDNPGSRMIESTSGASNGCDQRNPNTGLVGQHRPDPRKRISELSALSKNPVLGTERVSQFIFPSVGFISDVAHPNPSSRQEPHSIAPVSVTIKAKCIVPALDSQPLQNGSDQHKEWETRGSSAIKFRQSGRCLGLHPCEHCLLPPTCSTPGDEKYPHGSCPHRHRHCRPIR